MCLNNKLFLPGPNLSLETREMTLVLLAVKLNPVSSGGFHPLSMKMARGISLSYHELFPDQKKIIHSMWKTR